MGSIPASSKGHPTDIDGMSPRDAFELGLNVGLGLFQKLRTNALESATAELAKFKANNPEFYADVREEMASLFDARARGQAWPAAMHASAMAEVIRRDLQDDERAVLAQLSRSRFRGHDQRTKDLVDVMRFVELIRGGEVTKSAADKMGIGLARAKRLRGLAIELGLMTSRHT